MVGERGRQRVQDVGAKMDVPIFIAKKSIQLAHSGIMLLIAPCKLSILQVDLLELTRVECITEANNTTSVHICSVFVAGAVDLVEISSDQPSNSIGRPLANHFLKKGVLQIASCRSIHRGQLEGGTGLDNGHHG